MDQAFHTSQTNPLKIATVPVGTQGGLIGIVFAPGKHQDGMTAMHRCDLGVDSRRDRRLRCSRRGHPG